MLLYIRSAIYFVSMVGSAFLAGLLSLLVFPFSFERRFRFISLWARFNIWWLKIVCGVRYEVEGVENIPAEASIIYAKHSSTWETYALQLIFPPQTWVLKRELLRIPFFGWGLAMLKPVAIDRASGRKALKQLVELGTECLEAGRWLVVFPEGTRMAPGKMRKFGFGGAMLAEKSRRLLVPVAHNAGTYWPRHSFLKHPGTIKIVIGKPIATEGRKGGEINAEAEAWMVETMTRITGVPEELVERK